ncbi:MAG: hypothetical protein ACOC0X_03200 [Halobacteriota archaeon]
MRIAHPVARGIVLGLGAFAMGVVLALGVAWLAPDLPADFRVAVILLGVAHIVVETTPPWAFGLVDGPAAAIAAGLPGVAILTVGFVAARGYDDRPIARGAAVALGYGPAMLVAAWLVEVHTLQDLGWSRPPTIVRLDPTTTVLAAVVFGLAFGALGGWLASRASST